MLEIGSEIAVKNIDFTSIGWIEDRYVAVSISIFDRYRDRDRVLRSFINNALGPFRYFFFQILSYVGIFVSRYGGVLS